MVEMLLRPCSVISCPRCKSSVVRLYSTNTYPKEPNRRPLYCYRCECGLAFTSHDPPPNRPPQPR